MGKERKGFLSQAPHFRERGSNKFFFLFSSLLSFAGKLRKWEWQKRPKTLSFLFSFLSLLFPSRKAFVAPKDFFLLKPFAPFSRFLLFRRGGENKTENKIVQIVSLLPISSLLFFFKIIRRHAIARNSITKRKKKRSGDRRRRHPPFGSVKKRVPSYVQEAPSYVTSMPMRPEMRDSSRVT